MRVDVYYPVAQDLDGVNRLELQIMTQYVES
mgnify:CR=1 FL=1|jgi:hypothetical protein